MVVSPRRPARVVRSLGAAIAVLLLAGCAGEEPPPEGEAAAGEDAERMDLEALLDQEETEDDQDDPSEGPPTGAALHIEPGTMLGPGEVTTLVGDVVVAFDLPEAVEAGTVAPPDLPVALELIVDGGAIVVFEAVGHTRAGDPVEPVAGPPDDLEVWLTDDLPEELEVREGPTAIDGGVAVSLHNDDGQQTHPVALWRVEGDPIDTFEGHGPPPGQSQHLWLRDLDGAWVGVVTYGPAVDTELAAEIALSLRAQPPG